MMRPFIFVFCSYFLWQVYNTGGYRPVIVMHGVLDDPSSMEDLIQLIKDAHPGTEVHNVDAYNNFESFANMWEQVHGVQEKIAPIISSATDGVNLICFSQGGLICRGFLEAYPDHNVRSFVSLSSPQAGQFGDTIYLDWFFPNLTRNSVYLACYTDLGQDFSICNYWNDPLQQLKYQEYSDFLYPLNSGGKAEYKENFLKLENLVLIGGPDDGVITPWESSHFGFYDKNLKVQSYQNQDFYVKDEFGLKTLDGEGKVQIYSVPGVRHTEWHGNKTVFDNYIECYLT